MLPKNAIEKLSVAQLKAELEKIWRKHEKECRESMGEYLYWLRKKMRAQGARNDKKDKPEGFGIWCQENLHITRRTADQWANDWAVAQGLRKAPKKTLKTFGKISRSDADASDGDTVVVTYQMTLAQDDNRVWLTALRALGSKAQEIIFNAVIAAAAAKKPPVKAFLDEPDTILRDLEPANA